jgi:uncharacterized protein YciI
LFVFIVTFTKDKSEVEKYMSGHREFLDKALLDGVLVMSGGKATKDGGVIIAKLGSLNEAHSFIDKDPLKINCVAGYEVYEFTPSRMADEIGKLLTT